MKIFVFETEAKKTLHILGTPVLSFMRDALIKAYGQEACDFPGNFADSFDAFMAAISNQGRYLGDVIIFTVPMPLVEKDMLDVCLATHQASRTACTIFAPGVYLFQGDALLEVLANGYVPLEQLAGRLSAAGKAVKDMSAEASPLFTPVRNPAQLAEATALLMERFNRRQMLRGVFIPDPKNTYIGPDVTIGDGTVIYPGTYLQGQVVIGRNCSIGPNTKITDSRLGDDVKAEFSVILESEVGNRTSIGPYAYLRPHSKVGEGCKIGDFVEVKNSVIGDGSKASHLTYIGDSDVGKGVNFGCGTVTVNYDGANKFRTVIEDDVFVGCNTNLVAPVRVEAGAYVAAGSTLTEDVPENALAIARARQVNKTGWQRKQKIKK